MGVEERGGEGRFLQVEGRVDGGGGSQGGWLTENKKKWVCNFN